MKLSLNLPNYSFIHYIIITKIQVYLRTRNTRISRGSGSAIRTLLKYDRITNAVLYLHHPVQKRKENQSDQFNRFILHCTHYRSSQWLRA